MTEEKHPLKVFICHAHADRNIVHALYTRLTKDGVNAWLDKEKLLPGQDWELEIRKAVREADVVVVCLSKQFNQAGFRQKEVRLALDTAMEKPEGEIFIIPARLEECDNLESLRRWHWVDLFEINGYEMLMRAFQVRANTIGATLQIKRGWLPKVTPSQKKETTANVNKPAQAETISVKVDDKLNDPPKIKHKPNTAIIVALIGFAGTVLAGLLGSPIIGTWFSSGSGLTAFPTLTITLTPQPVIPSKTVEPNKTEIITPTVPPSLPISSVKDSGKIAFVSNRDGNEEIYVMNSDGSKQTRLTENPGRDFRPQWSPDGRKIAFVSERGDKSGLYIMNLDGTDQKPLSRSGMHGDISWLSWSPDGTMIVFVIYNGINGSDLFIISVATLNQFKLTDTPNISEFAPSWSPDGLHIAFFRENGLFVIDAKGNNEIEIRQNTSWRNSLSWSPDGSKIAFWGIGSRVFSGTMLTDEILVSDLKTNTKSQLTENENKDESPVWSPDGAKIAFVSSRHEGAYEIFIMNADGSNVEKLSNFSDRQVRFTDLVWPANGKRIIFVLVRQTSQIDINFDILGIDTQTNTVIPLSTGGKFDGNYFFSSSPAVQP